MLKLYRNFLFYKYFHGLEKPLIMCEGKTDNVYLSCALNQLVEKFPNLARTEPNPKTGKQEVRYKLQIFRNHGAVREIWNHASGASFLATIIRRYTEFLAPFKCNGRKFPVIMIVDNDAGPRKGGGVYKQIENVSAYTAVDGNDPYYRVSQNLYVVPLPKKADGNDIDFEGLFDVATRKRPHGNKTFKREPKDLSKEYGKAVFADHVIRPHQAEIDFSGFEPLLTVINEIVTTYTQPA